MLYEDFGYADPSYAADSYAADLWFIRRALMMNSMQCGIALGPQLLRQCHLNEATITACGVITV